MESFGSPKEWPSNLPPDAEFDFSAFLDKRIILSTTRALENQEAAGESIKVDVDAPSKHISELQTTAKKLNCYLLDSADLLQLEYKAAGSSESVYASTPTGSATSSVYSSLADFTNPVTVVLPPIPSCIPQPRSQAFIPQYPGQYPQLMPSISVPHRSMTGQILHLPQHPQPPVNYPVWNSVQKYIDTVTLCGTLISPDFRKTFYQKGVADAVVRAFLQRTASDAVSIIHAVHVAGRNKALEAIPDANGKANKKTTRH